MGEGRDINRPVDGFWPERAAHRKGVPECCSREIASIYAGHEIRASTVTPKRERHPPTPGEESFLTRGRGMPSLHLGGTFELSVALNKKPITILGLSDTNNAVGAAPARRCPPGGRFEPGAIHEIQGKRCYGQRG